LPYSRAPVQRGGEKEVSKLENREYEVEES
jgi:hypothetical protein